jgi:hypothetical protein
MLLVATLVTLWIVALVVWILLKLRRPRLDPPKPPVRRREGRQSRAHRRGVA